MENEKKQYFGQEVTNAIVEYQNTINNIERNKLCKNILLPAFNKLAMYYYHKLSNGQNEEIIHDCVLHLFENIHKFQVDKTPRAFPYFNVMARNFFYQRFKSKKKELSTEQDLISLNEIISTGNDTLIDEDLDEQIERKEFLEIFKEHLPKWRDKFKKPQQKQIVDALIEIFNNAENIEIFNKKELYFLLKEITNQNSKQVASNLNKVKDKFFRLLHRYINGDI